MFSSKHSFSKLSLTVALTAVATLSACGKNSGGENKVEGAKTPVATAAQVQQAVTATEKFDCPMVMGTYEGASGDQLIYTSASIKGGVSFTTPQGTIDADGAKHSVSGQPGFESYSASCKSNELTIDYFKADKAVGKMKLTVTTDGGILARSEMNGVSATSLFAKKSDVTVVTKSYPHDGAQCPKIADATYVASGPDAKFEKSSSQHGDIYSVMHADFVADGLMHKAETTPDYIAHCDKGRLEIVVFAKEKDGLSKEPKITSKFTIFTEGDSVIAETGDATSVVARASFVNASLPKQNAAPAVEPVPAAAPEVPAAPFSPLDSPVPVTPRPPYDPSTSLFNDRS